MGNEIEKSKNRYRYYKVFPSENETDTIYEPLSLNDLFQIETTLFRSPDSAEIFLKNTGVLNLEEKQLRLKNSNEKIDVVNLPEEIDLNIYRKERFSVTKSSLKKVEPYSVSALKDFEPFTYLDIFENVNIDSTDDFLLNFTSHATVLKSSFVQYLKANLVNHLMKDRRLNIEKLTFEKFIKMLIDDFTTNFKLFNYIQVYLTKVNKENFVYILGKMLSEEGDLINELNNSEGNINICLFALLIIFMIDTNVRADEIPVMYCEFTPSAIDINAFAVGNLLMNTTFLSASRNGAYFKKKNIIAIYNELPMQKFSFCSKGLFDISRFSNFKSENEVIISPNSFFEVQSIEINDTTNTLMIKLSMKNNFYSHYIPMLDENQEEMLNKFGMFEIKRYDNLVAESEKPVLKNCRKVLSLTFTSYDQIKTNSLNVGLMKNLFSLDLSNCSINDNDLTYFAPFLANLPFLKYLNLSQNSLSHVSIGVLTQTFKVLKYLEYLNLNQNELGDEGIIVLSNQIDDLENLQTLELVYNKIKYYGLNALGRKITSLRQLKSLNLSANFIYNEEMDALIASLDSLTNLNNLNLANNQIMSEGLTLLTMKMDKMPNLQHINLSENCIKTKGFILFSENLKMCPNILSLIFYGNQIGTNGMKALVDNLSYVPNLRLLNIGFNLLTDNEMILLSYGLKKIRYLEVLNLRENSIGVKGMKAFIFNVKIIRNLKVLDLGWNQINYEAICGISKAIKDLPSFYSLNIENNPIRAVYLKSLLHEFRGVDPSWSLVKGELLKNTSQKVAAFLEKYLGKKEVPVDTKEENSETTKSENEESVISETKEVSEQKTEEIDTTSVKNNEDAKSEDGPKNEPKNEPKKEEQTESEPKEKEEEEAEKNEEKPV